MFLSNLQGRALTVGITVTSGIGFTLFGWDQGMFGGILSNPAFNNRFNNPNATIQGQIVSTYDIGCILGAILSIFVGDRFGRRWSIVMACCFVFVGGILQGTSYGLPQMIVGRVVAGVGIGQNSATIPMWQAETSKPEHRGKLIALQLVIVIFGITITQFVNLGFTYVPLNEVAFRFPLTFQSFLALVTILLVLMMPESPRWLCYVDRHVEAGKIIARLQAVPEDSPSVQAELKIITETIAEEKANGKIGWREAFSNDEQQNFRRMCLGAGTSMFQQMGGINIVVYYLPVILIKSFGFGGRMALILTAVDFISLCFWGLMIFFVIDRIGRKKLMLYGAVGMSASFALAAVGLGIGTKASNGMAVAFIFVYNVCFGLSFLSIPFMYPSEINNQRMRNTGNAVAMITNWVCVYVIVLITPIAIANIQWRFYIIPAALNLSWVPIIWWFYVETAGLSLEEVDLAFKIEYHADPKISFDEARRLAKLQTRERRQSIRRQSIGDKQIASSIEEVI